MITLAPSMLTNAVAAPLTLIATGTVTDARTGTAVWSDARAACTTCATTAAATSPGAALAGGVSDSDTGSFPPGSSDATTSESVSQVAGEPGDEFDAPCTAPPGAAVASTDARRTVSTRSALRLTITNDRRTDAPGSTSTAIRGAPEDGAPPTVVTCNTLAGAPLTAGRAGAGPVTSGCADTGPFTDAVTAGAFPAEAFPAEAVTVGAFTAGRLVAGPFTAGLCAGAPVAGADALCARAVGRATATRAVTAAPAPRSAPARSRYPSPSPRTARPGPAAMLGPSASSQPLGLSAEDFAVSGRAPGRAGGGAARPHPPHTRAPPVRRRPRAACSTSRSTPAPGACGEVW